MVKPTNCEIKMREEKKKNRMGWGVTIETEKMGRKEEKFYSKYNSHYSKHA